ncbi:alginate O-acetyltransferase AlgF [Pseudaestuariivita atlantica]|uniref:Alginate biosynthesis protein AlgF n=1 Tax=Pseudaestuariivita atlantica TaxID=1317121 RepID=A0A0L1JNV3_9RHOB|nr:alginate O-acetyltransferase AlgF [Pseudaestuariivita atlantica]KNG93093.1 hypothetical protein ATO11_14380 [Pseudaestuariivita atlantica]
MTRSQTLTILSGIALMAVTTFPAAPVFADDAALYDAPAPEDAVFVRVLEEFDAPASDAAFMGAPLQLGEDQRDVYVAISAGALEGAVAGSYYSLADAGQVIEEPQRETAAKVHLILVNAGDAPVRLIVPGRGMEVVAAQAPGASASRAVNPVSATLAVERVTDNAILGTFDVNLARGQNVTFVAGDDAARLVPNSFGPVLSLN